VTDQGRVTGSLTVVCASTGGSGVDVTYPAMSGVVQASFTATSRGPRACPYDLVVRGELLETCTVATGPAYLGGAEGVLIPSPPECVCFPGSCPCSVQFSGLIPGEDGAPWEGEVVLGFCLVT
jgi:hypothetical protein